MNKYLAEPKLAPSQLKVRMGLARNRLHAFPLDDFNFLFNNIERPVRVHCQAHQCTGDLIGRILNAVSFAEGIDGKNDPYLEEIYLRMLRQVQKNGLVGVCAQVNDQEHPWPTENYNEHPFQGFIRYYELTGDHKALDVAKGYGDAVLKDRDNILNNRFSVEDGIGLHTWLTEPLSLLYQSTHDARYLELMKEIYERVKLNEVLIYGSHSHGAMTTLRGFQRMAIETGDLSYAEIPEKCRNIIIDRCMETVSGDVPESFPHKDEGILWDRNEACSVADWLMMNLYAGQYLDGEKADAAYAKAEYILWNALFYNQLVTGGLGHQQITAYGYGTRELQEAWWCCTMTGLLAMSEYARHAVTYSDEEIRVNFLLPGTYTFRNTKVTISSLWPGKAEARIRVENADGRRIYVRQPESIKNYKETIREENGVTEILVSGKIGHTIEEAGEGKKCLRYGILLLTFGNSSWAETRGGVSYGVPEGYAEPSYPSLKFKVVLPEQDENGFYRFPVNLKPEWASYEEGPNSRIAFEGACTYAKISFDNGCIYDIYCRPLCHLISSLYIYPRPLIFEV